MFSPVIYVLAVSDLVVKCHESRSLESNRRQARVLLAERLDRLLNGDESVAAQRERLERQKMQRNDQQRSRRRSRKEQWQQQRAAERVDREDDSVGNKPPD